VAEALGDSSARMMKEIAKHRSIEGFTLIELLVVVIIIGILAAIALPNFVQTQDKAKEAAVKSNMRTTQISAEAYSVDKAGVYPDKVATFDTYFPGGSTAKIIDPFANTANAIDDGPPGKAGFVGYQATSGGYQIFGRGKSVLLKNASGATLIITNL
jgi:prepilin-type N-terminal cleavage/methylation domain-containing protein